MTYLLPSELQQVLTEKSCYYCYVLFGDNQFLLNDTQNFIFKYIESVDICERFIFSLDDKSSWEKIFEISCTQNLFVHKKKFLY